MIESDLPSIGLAAQTACVLDVAAFKPGNVSFFALPGHHVGRRFSAERGGDCAGARPARSAASATRSWSASKRPGG